MPVGSAPRLMSNHDFNAEPVGEQLVFKSEMRTVRVCPPLRNGVGCELRGIERGPDIGCDGSKKLDS